MPKIALLRSYLFKSTSEIDKLTRCINFISADNGKCQGTMVVEQAHTNLFNSLHGGFAATLIDNISNVCLATTKLGQTPSVSISLNVDFYKAAYIGDELLVDAKIVKAGKSVTFLEIDVLNNATKELILKGTHIKHTIASEKAAKILKETLDNPQL